MVIVIFDCILSGGWSSDGITLPGALDIECEDLLCSILSRYELIIRQSLWRHMLWFKCFGNGFLDPRFLKHLPKRYKPVSGF